MKESHVASAISTVQTPKNYIPNMPQASRTAPPRPLISATRPAPPAPAPPPKNDATSLTADLRARNKAQGPATTNVVPQRSESNEQARQQERQEQLRQQEIQRQQEQRAQEEQRRQEEKQRQIQLQQQQQQEHQRRLEQQQQKVEPVRPQLPPSKSSPATTFPATHPAQGAAGSTTGPPPVLPLQPTKKVQIQHQEKPTKPSAGGVAAAAAALEKPKEKEKRISTMTEVQIMEKLRQVVSDDDPKLLYSKIKKVGQGYVSSSLPHVIDGNATPLHIPSQWCLELTIFSPFFGCHFVFKHMK